MAFLIDLLTLPVLGPIKGVYWLAKKVSEQAEGEQLDEDRVRGELLELQVRLELGEVTQEEYNQQEATLLERLQTIRAAEGKG